MSSAKDSTGPTARVRIESSRNGIPLRAPPTPTALRVLQGQKPARPASWWEENRAEVTILGMVVVACSILMWWFGR